MQAMKKSARQKSDSSALSATGGERQEHWEHPSQMHLSPMPLVPQECQMSDSSAQPLLASAALSS